MERQFSPIINEPVLPDEGKTVTTTNASILESKVDVPLSLRETPYTIDYFELKNTDLDFSQEVDALESFITKQIQSRNLEDNVTSYEKIIQELFIKAGVDSNEVSTSKLNKVLNYIELLNRNKTIEQRKIELLKKQSRQQIKQIESEKEKAIKEMQDKIIRLNKEKENILRDKEYEHQRKLREDQKARQLSQFKDFINKLI